MLPLPRYMRGAMLTTAVVNIGGSTAFLPAATSLREFAGMPEAHPVYLLTVGLFIGSFGLGYLYAGLTGRADRLFVAVAAGGKLSFVALLAWLCMQGELPWKLAASATPDVVFGTIFLYWLTKAPQPA